MHNIVVLDGFTLNPGDLSWGALERLGKLTVYESTPPELICERAGEAQIVFTNKTVLGEKELEGLAKLSYIGVLATGYNVVDVGAAAKRGIAVSNIPTYGTDSVAQFVFALLLELCHRVQRHSDSVSDGKWQRCEHFCYWDYPLMELAGKTMGIIGFGRIGRQTAKIADAFGMKVLAHDVFEADAPPYKEFRWGSMGEVLAGADVLSLHCPLTKENENLINEESLKTMKKSAYLINTSRGPLINENDLARALANGELAGAGLDVLPCEPPRQKSPLMGLDNCIVTPHIAWATKEARQRLMEIAAENVKSYLAGKPINIVNKI